MGEARARRDRQAGAIGLPKLGEAVIDQLYRKHELQCEEQLHVLTGRSALLRKGEHAINLPDTDPEVFSHTRLINDALTVLGQH